MASSQQNKTSTSPDHSSNSSVPLSFESWMKVLDKKSLSKKNQALWLKELQKHPEWINQTDEFLITPLMKASSCHTEVAKALINAGAALNLKSQWGFTALMRVSNQGNLDMVKELIQAKADLNLQNEAGWTSLMCAVCQGYQEVVQQLIDAGAGLNIQNEDGWTALMYASYQGEMTVVQALMNQGAHPELRNKDHQTAWDLAEKKGHDDVQGLLEAYSSRPALTLVIHPLEQPFHDIESKYKNNLSRKNPRL